MIGCLGIEKWTEANIQGNLRRQQRIASRLTSILLSCNKSPAFRTASGNRTYIITITITITITDKRMISGVVLKSLKGLRLRFRGRQAAHFPRLKPSSPEKT